MNIWCMQGLKINTAGIGTFHIVDTRVTVFYVFQGSMMSMKVFSWFVNIYVLIKIARRKMKALTGYTVTMVSLLYNHD